MSETMLSSYSSPKTKPSDSSSSSHTAKSMSSSSEMAPLIQPPLRNTQKSCKTYDLSSTIESYANKTITALK